MASTAQLRGQQFGGFRERRRIAALALLWLMLIAFAFFYESAKPAYACRDYDGHRNSVVPPSCGYSTATIHDVVAATWPAPLVPTAEQIAYHEGGGNFSDGYCSFGIIEQTQYDYGINPYSLDAYGCSAAAYRIYRSAGWGAWSTYGMYTPGAGNAPAY